MLPTKHQDYQPAVTVAQNYAKKNRICVTPHTSRNLALNQKNQLCQWALSIWLPTATTALTWTTILQASWVFALKGLSQTLRLTTPNHMDLQGKKMKLPVGSLKSSAFLCSSIPAYPGAHISILAGGGVVPK